MEYNNDKSIFDLEVIEKRRQAFLNRSKTGSKGGSKSRKGMRTPYTFMDKKDREKLNGEVRTYNMNSLMDWHTFEQKSKEEQTRLLTHWRSIYSNNAIMEAFYFDGKGKKFNSQSFADLINGLGIPKKTRALSDKPRKPRQSKAVAIAQEKAPDMPKLSLLEFADHTPPESKTEPQKLITKGLHLEYNGTYDWETINKILTKLQVMLDEESNKFQVSISITERAK